MKKFSILLVLVFFVLGGSVFAQSRKYIGHYSDIKSYYNPSLVGIGGSSANSVIRNQWGGIQGAPKTVFGSLEGDFSQIRGVDSLGMMGRNAMGLSIMYDQHGPFTEMELMVNYTNRIRVAEKHLLGLGISLKYQDTELDGTRLSPEQSDDPSLSRYLGGFAEMKFFDLNLGAALLHKKYYLAYSVQNIGGGKLSNGDDFYSNRPPIYNMQAGYRGEINDKIGLIGNLIYRLQKDLPYHAEFNVKALLMEKVWMGVGHRVDHATSLQTGFIMDRFKVGYIYEVSTKSKSKMYGSTHEFMASVRLFDLSNQGLFGMW